MRKLVSALLCLLLLTIVFGGARADDVPDPLIFPVAPWDALNGGLIAPGHPSPIAASILTITVRNSANQPIANASVEVSFAPSAPACPDAVNYGTTDANGRIILPVTGGGCADGQSVCTIRINGVYVRTYSHLRSPDIDGNLVVDLRDLLLFTSGSACGDMDNNDVHGLSDLLIFSAGFIPRHSCP